MSFNEPLRVCAFYQHMPPYPGAAALRGASILTALTKIFDSGEVMIEAFTTSSEPISIPGMSVISIGVSEVENSRWLIGRVLGELRMGVAAVKAIFNDANRCDFIIISSPSYLACLIIAAAARRRRVPYIVELRDAYPQVYAAAGLLNHGSLLYNFFARNSRSLYAGSSAVIAATQGLARTVLDDSPQSKVYSVYNGFPASLLIRQAKRHERFTVCFHGVLGFFQDIELLLELAQRLSKHEIDIVIIGYGRKEGLIAESGLPNLRFLGRQSFNQTILEIERCHIGLCLRKDESVSRDAFPVKVWEYMGLGMPCLITPICEAGKFVEANECGYQFSVNEVAKIVDRILALRRDSTMLREMSNRCRAIAIDYTREKTGLQAAKIVAECINLIKN